MKTKWILAGALFLLALVPNFATAEVNPNLIFRTSPEDDQRISITLANLQREDTQVVLREMDGNIIYARTIRNHNGYQMRLDLSELNRGRYMLQVTQDGILKTQIVSVRDDAILTSQIK